MRKMVFALMMGLISLPAFAKKKGRDDGNWANKNGVVGLGAGQTLGGNTGAQVRYFFSKDVGVLATLSTQRANGSTEPKGGKSTDTKDNYLDLGLYGEYKLLKGAKSSFGAVAGLDLISVSWDYGTSESYSDMIFGLGLKGECFLVDRFSIYSQLGLSVDPWGDAEAWGDAEDYEMDSTPDDFDSIKGNTITVGGGLLGSAGFTYWFD